MKRKHRRRFRRRKQAEHRRATYGPPLVSWFTACSKEFVEAMERAEIRLKAFTASANAIVAGFGQSSNYYQARADCLHYSRQVTGDLGSRLLRGLPTVDAAADRMDDQFELFKYDLTKQLLMNPDAVRMALAAQLSGMTLKRRFNDGNLGDCDDCG